MLTRFRIVVAIAGVTCCAVTSAATQEAVTGEVLTLEAAIGLGLQHNRTLRTAELEVGKAEDTLAAMRTRRGPAFDINFLESRLLADVNFQFPAGAFGVYPFIGPVPSEDTSVTTEAQWVSMAWVRVTQPLSQLHRIGLGVKLLELGRDAAAERLDARRQAVADDIRRLYHGILQTESGITARQESWALTRELDREVSNLVREQVALASEGLQVKAAMARDEAALLTLRNTLATQREQLNALLGRDIGTPFAVRPVPDRDLGEATLEVLEARALLARPEVKEATLAVERARTDVRLKRAELIPDVSALFSFVGFGRFEVLPPAVASVGVLVNWEPFDWGRKRREVASREKVVEQAAAGLADTESLVRVDVRRAFRKVAEANVGIGVARAALDAAREKLRVALARYREQRALFRTVLEAQAELAALDQQHQTALLALGLARADLERAVGGQ